MVPEQWSSNSIFKETAIFRKSARPQRKPHRQQLTCDFNFLFLTILKKPKKILAFQKEMLSTRRESQSIIYVTAEFPSNFLHDFFLHIVSAGPRFFEEACPGRGRRAVFQFVDRCPIVSVTRNNK